MKYLHSAKSYDINCKRIFHLMSNRSLNCPLNHAEPEKRRRQAASTTALVTSIAMRKKTFVPLGLKFLHGMPTNSFTSLFTSASNSYL